MKRNDSKATEVKRADKPWKGPVAIGMDWGDRTSRYRVLDGTGEVVQEGSVASTRPAMKVLFGPMKKCRIAMEVAGHSPWVSRLLTALGHEVIVAHPR
jgi:transposase